MAISSVRRFGLGLSSGVSAKLRPGFSFRFRIENKTRDKFCKLKVARASRSDLNKNQGLMVIYC